MSEYSFPTHKGLLGVIAEVTMQSPVESFLGDLRSRGAWQIESIKAVRELAGISFGEAKEIVHYTQTWADTRKASESLHETAYEALELMQQEQAAEMERIASEAGNAHKIYFLNVFIFSATRVLLRVSYELNMFKISKHGEWI